MFIDESKIKNVKSQWTQKWERDSDEYGRTNQ